MPIYVNSVAGLNAALQAATGGETIQLAPGVYSGEVVSGVHFTTPVTITSQDPTQQAVIQNLYVKNSDGLNFQKLEFVTDATTNPYYNFRVEGSTHVSFDSLNVHGSLDGNPQNDAFAFSVNTSDTVSITNSSFREVGIGVAHYSSNNLTISNNSFVGIRWDGIDGGSSSNVTVSHNFFSDFHPLDGEHPDAIQFWTSNATKSATNIVVTDNLVTRGGGIPIQGIFITDQVGNLPFLNVKISGNLVIGGSYNGITVGDGQSVTVDHNTVVALPDQTSWIYMDQVNGLTVTNNQTMLVSLTNDTAVTDSGNVKLAIAQDGGASALKDWLATHSTTSADLATFSGATSTLVSGSTTAAATTTTTTTATALTSTTSLATQTTTSGVVTLNGTMAADRLQVDGTHDTVVNGGDGNDVLIGGGVAHNTLAGGGGDDTYVVTSANDVVVETPNAGNDSVTTNVNYTLGANVENLTLSTGATVGTGNELNNYMMGAATADKLYGMAGADTIQGAQGNDLVSGGDGNDILYGGQGADTVTGDAGADRVTGDDGNDSLSGGAGADTIEGGAGADTQSGGLDADLFVFRDGQTLASAPDRILDFSSAQGDHISLTSIDANTLVAGDQAFTFIGGAAFHHKAGELHYEAASGGIYLAGDTNGDGIADIKIFLDGLKSFSSGDVWL